MAAKREATISPSSPTWVPPGPSRSPFQRFAGSLRRSRSSGALKSVTPLSDAAHSSSPSTRKAESSSARSKHTSPPVSPTKANYMPARPSPLTSSALLSFGSVSETEGDGVGTGYPWDPRPVTPREGSFGTLQMKPPAQVETASVDRTKKVKKNGLARVVSGSMSEFGARPDAEGGSVGVDDGREEGSQSRTAGGHGRSRSLFALSKKGRSSPAPPTPVVPSTSLPAPDCTHSPRKSSEFQAREDRSGESNVLRPRTLSKARHTTASRGSLSRPTSSRSPSSLVAASRPTSPEPLRLPNSFLSPPSTSPLSSPTTSSFSGAYSSRPSTFSSSLPTSGASSPTPSRSTSSMSGAFKTLRRKSSAVFGLGGGVNESTPELPTPEDKTVKTRPTTSPRPSTAEPHRSISSRASASSRRRSTTIDDRQSFTGLTYASPLASPSTLSLNAGDLFSDQNSSNKLRKQSKSISSIGAFKSLRRTTGRIGSVDAVGSTPDVATYPTRRKSEGGSPKKARTLDPSAPLPIISPRTSSQLNERPHLSSPSRSSLLLQSTPKPSPFKSLRKKTSQVFRSSPDLSLRRQNPTKHEHDQSPRKKPELHQNHRANKSTASLGLKLKLSKSDDYDDTKDDQEFGAGFKGFREKGGIQVDSYRSGKVGFSSKNLDTRMSVRDERVVTGAEGIDHRKRKSLGNVLVGLFKPLTPRRSASQSVNRGGSVFPEYSGISIQVSTDRVVTSQ